MLSFYIHQIQNILTNTKINMEALLSSPHQNHLFFPYPQTKIKHSTPLPPTSPSSLTILQALPLTSAAAATLALTSAPNAPSPLPSQKQRRQHFSFLESLFNAFASFINDAIDPPPGPTVDPTHVLSGNFAPVNELPPTQCHVIQGSLPHCLNGAYIRNGPNPQFTPTGPHHFFDGDGMLHSIRLSNGRAIFCSRYVKTNKYIAEQKAGYPLVPNIFSGFKGLAPSLARVALFVARIIAGHYNPENGIGLANTSLALFGNKLYALCESDLPYAIKLGSNGEIITLGREEFDGKMNSINMTAHTKSDPKTNETFAFQYCAIRPFLTFLRFDANGNKLSDVPIFSMTRHSLVHDLAITRKYAIFVEIQIGVKPMDLIHGGSLLSIDEGVPRIGIIRRCANDESEIQWFDVAGLNNLHSVNAWEEDGGDTVVLVAPNILSVQHFLDRTDLMHIQMEKVTINLKARTVSRQRLSSRSMDFGVINPAYIGKKSRFVYAAVGEENVEASKMPRMCGIAKIDVGLSKTSNGECIVGCRMYEEGWFGGEPFFIARKLADDADADDDEEEDDGYVVSYVHDERRGESRFLVMDARSPDLEIVAAIKLPQRVPYGLHGLFVKERDLNML